MLLHKYSSTACEFRLYVKQPDLHYITVYDHLPECERVCQRLSNGGIFTTCNKNKKNQDIKHDVVIIFRIVVVVCVHHHRSPNSYSAIWNALTSSINDDKLVDDSKKKTHITHDLSVVHIIFEFVRTSETRKRNRSFMSGFHMRYSRLDSLLLPIICFHNA